jgi:hypothetical protein
MDGMEVVRRIRIRELDGLLSELEMLNLREVGLLPEQLSTRLLQVGVPHDPQASISDLIDLVFRAQESYLHSANVVRRWSAA